jgi:ABC-2 type transport system permease protein
MISFPLFKRNMISAMNLSVIFLAVLAMYTTIIIYMFDPQMAEMLKEYQKMMPGMMSAVGMTGSSGTLIEFINTYLYGFIMLIIPMVFEIILVNKLLMKYVDSGSMACLLATPNSRKKIIVTQVVSIWLSIILLIVINTVIGLVSSAAMFPGVIDVNQYIQLNISILFLHLAISGIAFFASCLFNESKGYFSLGAGLPILFYLIQMLANMGGDLEFLKYFSIFTLFPGDAIVSGGIGVLSSNLILVGIGIVLYVSGSIRFIEKDLPI